MNALPILISGLFGWLMGHMFNLMERHSNWLRVFNYPIGVAAAAAGTMTGQSIPSLHNKVFLMGILCSGIALLLFQSVRRLFLGRRSFRVEA
ncbi:MAG: hypothetical protein ACREOO_24290 [bacterium]